MNPLRAERPGLAQRARGCLVVMAATLAAVAVLGFVVYELRAPLLTRVGGLLYYEDALEPADAIVVLSGGALDREVETADLFAAGYAPVVVLTRTPEPAVIAELQARGLDVGTQVEQRLDYLEALGVPREAITVLQRPVESTHAEAELIVEWAEAREIERIIVPCPSHSAAARYHAPSGPHAWGPRSNSWPTRWFHRTSHWPGPLAS